MRNEEDEGFVEVFPENFPSWARRRKCDEKAEEQEESAEEDPIRDDR